MLINDIWILPVVLFIVIAMYRSLNETTEYQLLNIIDLWNNGATLEEISRRQNLRKRSISKVLNFNNKFPILDFSNYHKDFKETRIYMKIVMQSEIQGLDHIEFKPFLLEALQGYGKTEMTKYLFRLGYRYYIKELYNNEPVRVKAIITNDFNYLFDNFPRSEVTFTAVDDADILHGKSLSAENQELIEKFWDIRHIQEKLYGFKFGVVTNILASHVPTSLMKKLRVSAKYKVYKNIFTDKKENWELRKKIGKKAFNFLKCVYEWRTISPIFSKFYVLEVGEKVMLGSFNTVKTRFPEVHVKRDGPAVEGDQLARELLALRCAGYEYKVIKAILGYKKGVGGLRVLYNDVVTKILDKYDEKIKLVLKEREESIRAREALKKPKNEILNEDQKIFSQVQTEN